MGRQTWHRADGWARARQGDLALPSPSAHRPSRRPPPPLPGAHSGQSQYRGVTRHHAQGRWEARIGRVAGTKYLYLGSFETAGGCQKGGRLVGASS